MSFGKPNRSSYGKDEYNPNVDIREFTKDYAFESSYRRSSNNREPDFYRSPKTR